MKAETSDITGARAKDNSPFLVALILTAAVYVAWQYYLPALSGDGRLDGIVGVVLGLFICSRPAANGIDLIFLERGAVKRALANSFGIVWLLLNGLVMFVGWFVISVGAARLTTPPPVPSF